MTKEEIAALIEQMPQGMDANDYIYELVNRALLREEDKRWGKLAEEHLQALKKDTTRVAEEAAVKYLENYFTLKEKNT